MYKEQNVINRKPGCFTKDYLQISIALCTNDIQYFHERCSKCHQNGNKYKLKINFETRKLNLKTLGYVFTKSQDFLISGSI